MARPLGDAFASIAALAVLVGVLVSVDGRVRQQIALRISSAEMQAQMRDAGIQLRSLPTVVAEAVRYQSVEHAPMMFLVVTACVLVVFMLRM